MPDYLIIDNDTLAIHSNPLEPYFLKNPIKDGIITSSSTALWRGYIAYFKFNDGKLTVDNIYTLSIVLNEQTGTHHEKLTSIYNDIFGDLKNFECDFFTGVLICPFGEILEYVHMGYSSIYENYKLIEVNNGNYIKEKVVDNDEFMKIKISHYEHFKKTPEYKKLLEETIEYSKQADKEIEKYFDELLDDDMTPVKKTSKKDRIKSAEEFLFFYLTDNIKTIDISN